MGTHARAHSAPAVLGHRIRAGVKSFLLGGGWWEGEMEDGLSNKPA